MNLDTLKRQLVREFRASPVKAIALAALSVVGVYFWGPIILKGFSKKSTATAASTPPPAATTPSATSFGATTTKAPAAKTESGLPDWHDVADWIKQDARMSAAEWTAGSRDPFEVVKKKAPAAQPKPEMKKLAPAKPKEIDPDDLGLVVSSIALGPGGRTALVNGETYREGQAIELEDGMRVQLKKVMPKRVQFECQGQAFELAVAKSGSESIRLRKP